MHNKLLMSAAAIALIAGGGLASAQMPAQSQGPGATQSAPRGGEIRGDAHMKGGADVKGTTGAASEETLAPQGGAANKKVAPRATTTQAPAKNELNKNQMKSSQGDKSRSTTGQAPAESPKSGADVKSRSDKSDMNIRSRTETKSSTTTGQGAAGSQGAVNLSTEQRTKIKTVIKEKSHFKPITNANFSVSIGTRVPRSVQLYPLPVDVVRIYPSWRGYEFIQVGDEIVVINPRTLEIVAVLEA